jgi:DNA ligase (NAD+)
MLQSNITETLDQTRHYLQVTEVTTEEQTAELRNILRFHEYRYYTLNDPLIGDTEYDSLYKLLERTELVHPEWVTPDSPTQRVGASLNAAFEKVQHLVPMLSLDNSYNPEDLRDWDRRVREGSGLEQIEYCVEPKFDGASISVIYEHNRLARSATRGDGTVGEEITVNSKQIRTIPLSANFSSHGIESIEIRGEVLMTKRAFAAYNEGLAAQNLPPLANPRNAASGSLRMKDPKEVGRRALEAILYHVSYVLDKEGSKREPPQTHYSMLEMLQEVGFKTPVKDMKVYQGIDEVVEYCLQFEEKREALPFEIDGMVVKVNNLELQEKLGQTTHHPRWAIAYKFKARQATSILRNVEFNVGRTGSVTPVANIDPVYIGGVTVSNIALFNEDVIREKDLMLGDHVLVERAGDVIPYIVKSLAEARSGSEQPIVYPRQCPKCNAELFKEVGEAVWRCVNAECPAQAVERLIHFVSKDAMDIKTFGEQQVKNFYEDGALKDIPGIYQMDFEALGKKEGYKQKSIDNLRNAIEASKTQPLYRLIFGLGIRYVGETTAKTLANAVHHLLDLKTFTLEGLLELEDIGPKVANSVHHFFQAEQNLQMIAELEALGLNLINTKKAAVAEGGLSGQTFLFTGTLNKLKRTEAEERVEALGGKVLGGVSSKLNYLVVGEDAGSKLEKAKKLGTVKVISEDEFLRLVEEKIS